MPAHSTYAFTVTGLATSSPTAASVEKYISNIVSGDTFELYAASPVYAFLFAGVDGSSKAYITYTPSTPGGSTPSDPPVDTSVKITQSSTTSGISVALHGTGGCDNVVSSHTFLSFELYWPNRNFGR